MSRYFQYFPKIKYGDKVMTDITKNVRLLDDIESDPYAFLPYTVGDEESPEDIALYYYEDINHVWLVYASNKIVDPYFQWPLSNKVLESTIQKKYKAQAEQATGGEMSPQSVLQWTQDEDRPGNIVYYYGSEGTKITVDTYTNGVENESIASADWTAMRIYDEELRLNEDKRDIRLLNREYTKTATRNLKRVLNG